MSTRSNLTLSCVFALALALVVALAIARPRTREAPEVATSQPAATREPRIEAIPFSADLPPAAAAAVDLDSELWPLISDLPERDLRDWLTCHTALEEGDLEGLRDLHRYVMRLAHVALEDTSPRPEATETLAPVRFARYVDRSSRPVDPRHEFDPFAHRIYAVFATPDPHGRHVTVRWGRVGEIEPLLLRRYPVDAGAAKSHVWLRRERFEPGTYVVRIYSDDDAVSAVAEGTYTVVAR
jgi:hypothetical protein